MIKLLALLYLSYGLNRRACALLRFLHIDNENDDRIKCTLAFALIEGGEFEDALQVLKKPFSVSGRSSNRSLRLLLMSRALANSGRREEARGKFAEYMKSKAAA